jgi:type II secretory pathway pseudopilin PulG
MMPALKRLKLEKRGGFTLAEAVLALGVLSFVVVLCLSAISFSRVTSYKAKEEAVAMGFLEHYAELLRGLPFAQVLPGWPLNPLLDGTGGGPNIRLPTNDQWFDLNTDDYLAFHPDLIWLAHRNPQMRVVMTTTTVLGQPHTRHLRLEIRWDPPLGRGQPRVQRLDVIRVKDL